MPIEADELVTPLDPIYIGITHNAEYDRTVKKAVNTAKYNRDTAKIIDRCWDCSFFGMGATEQDRRTRTKCQRCRAAMLKAIELNKK